MVGGFALGSKSCFSIAHLLTPLIGLCLVIASACICNQYIDRSEDQKMARTKNRPLVRGTVSSRTALGWGVSCAVSGMALLALATNMMAVGLTAIGFFAYVVLYGHGKYLSLCGTPLGSIAGAIPPVVGYCAVTGSFDMEALLLFLTMICWQMPHFYSIAIYRLDEYAHTSFAILPIQKGTFITKIHMLAYIAAFLVAASSTVAASTASQWVILTGGGGWLWLCWRGFFCSDEKAWARQMFLFSLVLIGLLNALLVLLFVIP
jgi:protoheme IX farnesyltransferase